MDGALSWNAYWAWRLPLIVLNVISHVIGLGFIKAKVVQVLAVVKDRQSVGSPPPVPDRFTRFDTGQT
jgi:hypothetical protein